MPEVKSNTEQLRDWFRSCPAIINSNRFRVDYLSDSPTEYSINAVPSTIAYRENVLGEEIPLPVQTLNFIFASKESYGADVQQNLLNLGFYENVIAWVLEKNAQHDFPTINEGRVRSIVPTLTAYPVEIGSSAAKYQIQLKMTYKREE